MSGVNEVQLFCVQKIVVTKIRGDKSVAAQCNSLRNIIAAGTAAGFATKTKDIVFFAYAVVPGILSLLSAIPIFKYDIVGKKKQEISDALQARRTAAAAEK